MVIGSEDRLRVMIAGCRNREREQVTGIQSIGKDKAGVRPTSKRWSRDSHNNLETSEVEGSPADCSSEKWTGCPRSRTNGMTSCRRSKRVLQARPLRFLREHRKSWDGPFLRIDISHLPGFLVVATELQRNRTVTAALIDLVHSVSVVTKVPCRVALNISLDCSFHVRILVFKNRELFTTTDGITGEFLEGLIQADPFNVADISDQACLVSRVVELLVEGQQIIYIDRQVFCLGDCGRDFNEQGLVVELFCREKGSPHEMTQSIQAAEKEREVEGSGEAVKVVLLYPAALKDYQTKI